MKYIVLKWTTAVWFTEKKKLIQTGLSLKTNFEYIARDVSLKVKSTLHILSKSITKCPVAAYAFRVPSILCLYVVRVSSFTSFILPEMPTTNTPLRKLLSLPNLTDFDWQIYKLCNNDTNPTKSITRWTKFWLIRFIETKAYWALHLHLSFHLREVQ